MGIRFAVGKSTSCELRPACIEQKTESERCMSQFHGPIPHGSILTYPVGCTTKASGGYIYKCRGFIHCSGDVQHYSSLTPKRRLYRIPQHDDIGTNPC